MADAPTPRRQPIHDLVAAVRHAAPASCGTIALGAAIASTRARQLRPPPAFFVAAGVGCGLFRLLHRLCHHHIAATVASVAFFRLCSHSHKHVVLSYAAVEAVYTYYLAQTRRLPQWVELCVGVAITSRLMYTFLFHANWLLPSHLRMLDHQSGLSPARLASLRANLHDPAVARCAGLHPHTASCSAFAVQATGQLVSRSVAILAPLQVLTMVGSFATTKKAPDLSRQLTGLVQSVAFLTTNYLFPYMASCALPQSSHKAMLTLAALTPSLAQLFESPKRRLTILKAVACYSAISVVYQAKALAKGTKLKLSGTREAAAWTVLYAALMAYLLQRPTHTQNQWLVKYLGLPAPPPRPKASHVDDCKDMPGRLS